MSEPRVSDEFDWSCVVEVGHSPRTPGRWFDELSGVIVCDRHRGQYDERPDLGPYEWVAICGDSSHRHGGPCSLYPGQRARRLATGICSERGEWRDDSDAAYLRRAGVQIITSCVLPVGHEGDHSARLNDSREGS